MGIYLLTYDNNKIYIGQAVNIRARAIEHNNKNIYPCDKALKIHNATLTILEIVNEIESLEEKEIYYINCYDATNKEKGYNLLKGGNASGKRGIENCNAKFNEQELKIIIDLLINHPEMSIRNIAKQFNVNENTILKISRGQTYINPDLNYPLRNNNHEASRKDDIKNYFSDINELISLKEDLLYRWDLEIENDLTKKYNLPIRIIRDINNGYKFQNIGNYKYPIRNKNIRNYNNFSQEDILNILNLLRNTNITMANIAKKYNINRGTVTKINAGKSYIIKNYDYPARKTN